MELAAKRAHERVLARARAQRRRREVQRTMLYTDPVTPRAGQTVTVYYNPDATVLRGRPEVWLRGSWNRCHRMLCPSLSPPLLCTFRAASLMAHTFFLLHTCTCPQCRYATYWIHVDKTQTVPDLVSFDW